MATITAEIKMTHGAVGEISGVECGPFIVHRNLNTIKVDFEEFPTWLVTHPRSGMRFPWSFTTEEAALAFCNDVLPVMEWDKIDATFDGNSSLATWGRNEPTKEQKDSVRALAADRGGIRIMAYLRYVQNLRRPHDSTGK